MSSIRVSLGAAVLWAGALGMVAAQGVRPGAPAVFTAGQAERGREEYTTACAHCHRSDLLGDIRFEIPSLAEDDFFVRWSGRTAGELFRMISTDMPADKPGGLTQAAYVDILAYILQVNRFPSGTTELRADADRLKQIVLEQQR